MWKALNEKQKKLYKQYCDGKYGDTIVFSENGEPLYFERNGEMINTSVVLKFLFNINEN